MSFASFGSAFGGVSTSAALPANTGNGTASPHYQVTSERESPTATSMLDYQAITAMPAYRGFSFEELRLQDYNAGRKPPLTSGSRNSTRFGNNAGEAAINTLGSNSSSGQPSGATQAVRMPFGNVPLTTNVPIVGGIQPIRSLNAFSQLSPTSTAAQQAGGAPAQSVLRGGNPWARFALTSEPLSGPTGPDQRAGQQEGISQPDSVSSLSRPPNLYHPNVPGDTSGSATSSPFLSGGTARTQASPLGCVQPVQPSGLPSGGLVSDQSTQQPQQTTAQQQQTANAPSTSGFRSFGLPATNQANTTLLNSYDALARSFHALSTQMGTGVAPIGALPQNSSQPSTVHFNNTLPPHFQQQPWQNLALNSPVSGTSDRISNFLTGGLSAASTRPGGPQRNFQVQPASLPGGPSSGGAALLSGPSTLEGARVVGPTSRPLSTSSSGAPSNPQTPSQPPTPSSRAPNGTPTYLNRQQIELVQSLVARGVSGPSIDAVINGMLRMELQEEAGGEIARESSLPSPPPSYTDFNQGR